MPEPISVALVDDDPLVLRLLTDMLTASGIDVAWAAQGADEAVARVGTDAPDVIAVDVLMPGQDGHALTRRLLASFGPLTVVMLTSLDDPDSLAQALAAGVIGYLVKMDPPERIVAGLRAAAAGLRPFSTALPPPAAPRRVGSADPLSPRELEVLRLAAESLTNEEIAERLVLSPATVKRHVASILAKTDAPDRLGAVMWAVRRGLIAA
ncbi:MAG TPA: response regulator transcription factor [Arachnia sp.]|nr:response regulator transcription factor [Arachnia sp.]